jgi:hypothetical protein
MVQKLERRFINLGHFVAETEFDWRALDGRTAAAAVPGINYRRRDRIKERLRAAGRARGNGWFRYAMATGDRLGLRPYARPLLQQFFQSRFVREIAGARYAYTDGSGNDRPIRKFFEIPALGTVLLCTPCAGFDRLGFVDRDSAVVVDADDVLDALAWLDRSPDIAQRIADAGRDLVWQRHSLHARAEQFTRCLAAIGEGHYAGSSWEHGAFLVKRADAQRGTSAPVRKESDVRA